MSNGPVEQLHMEATQVARLTKPQREARVHELVSYAHELLDAAIQTEILGAKRSLAGIAVLYSGGNDSTTLAHMFRGRATCAMHANTGIGVEQTRQFVRDTCAGWGLPLIEKSPPDGSTYRELVIERGFPGPAHHWKMYQRLKERALDAARREVVKSPHRERVVLLAGRRRQESERRSDVPEVERDGSAVWVSPLVHWTALDLNTYRLMHSDVPRNGVSDRLHMSGECLCGSFAKRDELDEIGFWYPDVREQIEQLEDLVMVAGKVPAWKARWGWGADKALIQRMERDGMDPDEIAALFTRSTSGRLCSSCATR